MSLLEFWGKLFRGRDGKSTSSDFQPFTLQAEKSNSQLDRPIVFDPALRPLTAHRAGEPNFKSTSDGSLWYSLRLAVLHHLLTKINDSPWQQHLVLRGSALLATWCGEQARRPGDLDWVVKPASWKLKDQPSQQLIDAIVTLFDGATIEEGLTIPRGAYAIEEIWTYERAPGLRVVFCWAYEDADYSGTVQMDFVFGETLPSPPVTTAVVIGDLPAIEMQTASPEQSLAWKLKWLSTDCYPMGKDLYDAVLLAERFPLSQDLLSATFLADPEAGLKELKRFTRENLLEWNVDWDEFVQEYPHVVGSGEEWTRRLAEALGQLFEELERNSGK